MCDRIHRCTRGVVLLLRLHGLLHGLLAGRRVVLRRSLRLSRDGIYWLGCVALWWRGVPLLGRWGVALLGWWGVALLLLMGALRRRGIHLWLGISLRSLGCILLLGCILPWGTPWGSVLLREVLLHLHLAGVAGGIRCACWGHCGTVCGGGVHDSGFRLQPGGATMVAGEVSGNGRLAPDLCW